MGALLPGDGRTLLFYLALLLNEVFFLFLRNLVLLNLVFIGEILGGFGTLSETRDLDCLKLKLAFITKLIGG